MVESILKYFKYDPRTHCEYPDIPASKPGGRPNKRINEKDASQSKAKKSKRNVQEGGFMDDNLDMNTVKAVGQPLDNLHIY